MQTLAIEDRDGIRVLRLSKGRGNAIDEALVADLSDAVKGCKDGDAVRAVLLASTHPKLFCPGFDLMALSAFDRPGMERFILRFSGLVRELYALPKPVVAAIAGHAVAGGCILALTADYRILARGGVQIGLNEVRVGVPIPWAVTVLLRATVSPSALTRTALLGRNFTDDAALSVGLCDELADTGRVEEVAIARLAEFLEKDSRSLGITKRYLRADALKAMETRSDEALREFVDTWFSESTRARVRDILASLTSRGGRV